MKNLIEIKRKEFEVLKQLGDYSWLATRKNKLYFIKDFGKDEDRFWIYVETENKLNSTGIAHPKVYTYDKHTHFVASEFVEGEKITDLLLKENLSDLILELIFKANWFSKRNKVALNYEPNYWIFSNNKLFYIGVINEKYDTKLDFEKHGIRLWFYTRDFVSYLTKNGIRGDLSRIGENESSVNKRIALAVVKYYL